MSTPDEPLYHHRSPARRRRDLADFLAEHPELSDRRVARIVDVSRELVGKVRRNMIRLSQIPSRYALRRVGADGKTYKRLPQPRI
jgi:hypothetical protein